MTQQGFPTKIRPSQSGNIVFALLGAVALLGVLGMVTASFVRGPLTSTVTATNQNVAESQMLVMSQAIVMQSAASSSCDADPFIEPIMWRLASGTETTPTGGGLLPTNLSVATTKDPWGTEYGYCVWDHGSDACTGPNYRLRGATTNAEGQTVIALISAGPDKSFATTCRTFAAADGNSDGDLADAGDQPLVSKNSSSNDDILFTYTYRQAAAASGGLWSLKSGDDTTAVIGRDLAVTGNSTVQGEGAFSGLTVDAINAKTGNFIDFLDGVQLPDRATYNPACNGTTEGVIRRNGSAIELCYSNTWGSITGGGGASGGSQLTSDTSSGCSSSRVGYVRYNTAAAAPQYCDGTSWRSLIVQTSLVFLQIEPSFIALNVNGPCSTDCPYAHGPASQNVTVTNIGSANSGNITTSVNNAYINAGGTTCSAPLAPGASCVISVSGWTSGNYTLDGHINVLNDGIQAKRVTVLSTGTGFGCTANGYGWGGQIVSCTNPTTPNYIISFPGCDGTTVEPYCTGSGSDDPLMYSMIGARGDESVYSWPTNATNNSGSQNSVNLKGYAGSFGLSGAAMYCDALVQQGYDDWYLPSLNEWQTLIYPSRAQLQVTDTYWTSNYDSSSWYGPAYRVYNVTANTNNLSFIYTTYKVRCLRRHATAFPAIQADNSPNLIVPSYGTDTFYRHSGSPNLGYDYATAASQTVYGEVMTVSGINVGQSTTVSGPAGVSFSINGKAGVTSGTVYNGDTIQLIATGPASTNTQNSYTLTIGGTPFNWYVRYPASNTRRIFVTSTTSTGNLSGVSGADTICQNRATAASLTGNWYAVIGTLSADVATRLPWNWNKLENMQGEVVATNYRDLFFIKEQNDHRESIGAAIKYDEFGNLASGNYAWVGVWQGDQMLQQGGPTSETCNDWTNATAGYNGTAGKANTRSELWSTASYSACNVARSLYCIGPF